MRGGARRPLLAAVQQPLGEEEGVGEWIPTAPVQLVVTDLDGTLLCRNHSVGAATEAAIQATLARDIPFVVATGKSRAGAVNSVGAALGAQLITGPGSTGGVFLQGLLTYGPGGELLRELSLSASLVERTLGFAAGLPSVTVIAYQRDDLLCEVEDKYTLALAGYKEPRPRPVGDLRKALLSDGATVTSKLLLYSSVEEINRIRPLLEAELAGEGEETYELTQALPEMLEVLPAGGNKGAGVLHLLEHLGVAPEAVMGMGDGENDIEMLQQVGTGVAMANARSKLKAVATHVMGLTNEDGGAAAALRSLAVPES
uniref:Haloacid dehalogenase-like hydrolase n=1 Tax=Phaeomonas parva TaxID=124430 RepID=A0A7S1U9R0_9STRA